jgi:shikimate dehydrogenase
MLVGVLGWPVAHSRSPAMHNAAFRELGLDWLYLPLPVPPELFDVTLRALPGAGYGGANVTVPHKLAAHALCDELSEAARAIWAVNALSFRDGRIAGENTDAPGLLDAIGEPVAGQRALVLGAGGVGRAAAWALREGGAEVSIWNRTAERAADLAAELGVRHAERPGPADIVVNSTSVGLERSSIEEVLAALGLANAEPPALLVDLPYGAEPTALVAWAHAAGARVIDGLEVLVRQGVRSFALWTGAEPPLGTMRNAARHG